MAPGIMRLFVRVEGSSPFSLILDDNLLPEHYVEIALKYYKEHWHATRATPDLVLIRRVIFRNQDQLLDFRKKRQKRVTAASLPGAIATGPAVEHGTTGKVYDSSSSADLIRSEYVVTMPPQTSAAWSETEMIPKSVKLTRLVMKITDPTSPPHIEDVFWDTYRQFATPAEVLELFIQRFEVPEIAKLGEMQRSPLDEQYYSELQLRIKLKVMLCLENWVSRYYFDFGDDAVHHRLDRWVREKIDLVGVPSKILTLMRTNDRTALKQRPPVTAPGKLSRNMPPSTVLANYNPRDIASQLTLLTKYYHDRIYASELIGKQWEGANAVNVPNFVAYKDFINRVSNWVTYVVVSEQDDSRRANNVGVLLVLCDELMKLRNWDMLVAVHGGLTDPPVARLSKTWAAIPPAQQALVPKLEELLNVRSSSQALKTAMAASPRPHFPSIIVYLRELMALDDAPAMADGGMINFLRCIHQHNLVTFLLDGKHCKLEFVENEELQAAFSMWRPIDDGTLAAESKRAQP